jgi:phosphoribosylamine--glycine ligase
MAAQGYPGSYTKGDIIHGLRPDSEPDRKVFHAGTAEKNGAIVTHGGRVLCATALGESVSAAQARAYDLVKQISWKGAFYRRDIGFRAIERERPLPG